MFICSDRFAGRPRHRDAPAGAGALRIAQINFENIHFQSCHSAAKKRFSAESTPRCGALHTCATLEHVNLFKVEMSIAQRREKTQCAQGGKIPFCLQAKPSPAKRFKFQLLPSALLTRLPLAMRAKNRTAACNLGFFKGLTAAFALLPAAPVHGKGILKGPHIAVRISVVAYGAAAL